MNVLITGSDGFIGKKLGRALKKKDVNVFAFGRNQGDISSSTLKYKNIDVVIHLCAKVFVPASWEAPFEFYKTNLLGTINVLEFCKKTNAKIIYLSSYIYGKPQYLPVDEKHPISIMNPYMQTKVMAEQACVFYSKNFNIQSVILRPFNIYGPGQNGEWLVPKIINQVLDKEKETIELFDLKPKRDLLYVDDLIDAIMVAINCNSNEVYNVGSGYSVSISKIVKTALKCSKISKNYIGTENVRKGEINNVVADISKIEKDLGWTPKISLSEGLNKCLYKL